MNRNLSNIIISIILLLGIIITQWEGYIYGRLYKIWQKTEIALYTTFLEKRERFFILEKTITT